MWWDGALCVGRVSQEDSRENSLSKGSKTVWYLLHDSSTSKATKTENRRVTVYECEEKGESVFLCFWLLLLFVCFVCLLFVDCAQTKLKEPKAWWGSSLHKSVGRKGGLG